jgi:outer membrane protein insertion porin family
MRSTARRLTLTAGFLLASVVVCMAVLLWGAHSSTARRMIVDRLVEGVRTATGLDLRLSSLEMPLLLGGADFSGIELRTADDAILASIGEIRVRWSWWELATRRRVELVGIRDPAIDLDELLVFEMPVSGGGGDGGRFELGRLDVDGLRLHGDGPPVGITAENLAVNGSLDGTRGRMEVDGGRVDVRRDGRPLRIESIGFEAALDEGGLHVADIVVIGPLLEVAAGGHLTLESSIDGRLEGRLSADAALVPWWFGDEEFPLLASGRVAGPWSVNVRDGAVAGATFRHDGAEFDVVGLKCRTLEAKLEDGSRIDVRLAGPTWGQAGAVVDAAGFAARASVERWSPMAVLSLVNQDLAIPAALGVPGLTGSGELRGPWPVDPATVSGRVDATVRAVEMSASVAATLADGRIFVEKSAVSFPGGEVEVAGGFDLSGRVDLEASGQLHAPVLALGWFERVAATQLPDVGADSLRVAGRITGSVDDPSVVARAAILRPMVDGVALERLDATVAGGLGGIEWTVATSGDEGLTVEASGTADPRTRTGGGVISARVDRLGSWRALAPTGTLPESVNAAGISLEADAALTTRGLVGSADVRATTVSFAGHTADAVGARFEIESQRVTLSALALNALGGTVTADGDASWEGPPTGKLRVAWEDLETGRLVADPRAAGRISGRMELSGDLDDTVGEGWARWAPERSDLPPVDVRMTVADGTAQVRLEPWDTAAGVVTARAEIPVKDLATSEGGGSAVTATLDVLGMSALGAATIAGVEAPEGDLTGRLSAALQWRLGDPMPQVQGTLEDAAILSPLGEFAIEEDIAFGFDGEVFRMSDAVVVGENATVIAGGTVDLGARAVDFAANLRIAPELGAVLPVPVFIRQPITVETRLRGPWDRLEGLLRVDHRGGQVRMRDPAVQISDFTLDVGLRDGIADVRSGSMALNQGRVDLGGGWDRRSGQGLVLEIDRVAALLPMGILSRWSGNLAVEPAEHRLVRVVGELELDGGLWDEDVDIASFILGSAGEATAEALSEIELDIEVRSRGSVRVNNNLGQFDVRWSGLEISGTAAEPVVRGSMRILPGGQVRVGGATVALKRGTLRFTGDPLTDPVLDLVPEDSLLAAASGEQDGANTSMAVQGLASGLGSVLGFENETIPMSEISAETDTDTSTEFAIGRQLTSSVALFLTTDLSDAQSRTTVFQVWRLPTLPGLRFQAKTKTDTGESDLRATQIFRWGGAEGTAERPRIRAVRFRGEWPVRTWGLGRVTGLASGEPLDSFQLLAAAVRLERRLAERGWPEATVTAELDGRPERPTVVFRCEAGPRIAVDFEGDGIPTKLERRAVAQYRFPPGERLSLRAMEGVVMSGLRARGFANPMATATALGNGQLVVDVTKGAKDTVEGPVVTGIPADLEADLVARLGSPAEIRAVADDPERGERLVRRILAARGYRDPERVEVLVTHEEEASRTVVVEVEPGEPWRIARTSVTGQDPLDLGGGLSLPAGATVDRGRIESLASRVRRQYRAEGWGEADVQTAIEADPASGDAAVRWSIQPGVRTRLDSVEVEGLRHLDPALVERVLDLGDGGSISLETLDEAAGMLATFPPVERVELVTEPTSVSGRRVTIHIDEKPRWGVEVGGSWNSDFGLGFRTGIRDENLFGRGLSFYLGGRWQERALDSRMVLALPPRPGGRMGLGLTLEYSETPRPVESIIDVEIEDRVGQVTFDARWQILRKSLVRGYVRFSRTRTLEVDPEGPFPIDDVSKLGIVGTQWITDLLDNPIDPRSGSYIAADLSTATEALGSDSQHVRLLLTGSLVVEPWRDVTWMQTLRLGGSEPLGGTELFGEGLFYAGGPATIRGFEIDTVGPTFEFGDFIDYEGGGAMFILNEELRFPVWQDLRGAVFVDIGQVWRSWSEVDSTFAVGTGIGIRWGTPVGPLWVDAAWPVADRGRNEGVRYSFGIGRTF